MSRMPDGFVDMVLMKIATYDPFIKSGKIAKKLNYLDNIRKLL